MRAVPFGLSGMSSAIIDKSSQAPELCLKHSVKRLDRTIILYFETFCDILFLATI
ncbi:MAG: hypothetical protein K0R28_2623 [Paenibacillus sp.]|jgi:hypothetical protein|nr:hypothetical protein [Paenibacillus sp.]